MGAPHPNSAFNQPTSSTYLDTTTMSLSTSDFQKINDEASDLRDKHGGDYDIMDAFYDSKLKTKADFDAYSAWSDAKINAMIKAEVSVPSARKIMSLIKGTDFRNSGQRAHLNEVISKPAHPYLGLGHHHGWAYRLSPNPWLLSTTPDDSGGFEDNREVLLSTILGMNHGVEPAPVEVGTKRDRREANISDESADSGYHSSDKPNDETGFVFYQLGSLLATSHSTFIQLPEAQCDAKSVDWIDTGYVVVVRIHSDGKSGPVWLLCNFNPQDENGDQHQIDASIDSWGRLPGDLKRRAAVKIADQIGHLHHKNPLSLQEVDVKTLPFTLVNAVIDDKGRVIRQKVTN
ncbi:hypothetical protein BDV96DRAFT_587885 [Lophiotrema nucula]|uniref:Uncharacterized protein n=1 Tax=Lophiotrema nucula TaxID=690887 RepID=A0A6A5YP75_9PLEO|nr:hypothetical protein BDV96DRAFT_587885 [Lophiotrema nucula]